MMVFLSGCIGQRFSPTQIATEFPPSATPQVNLPPTTTPEPTTTLTPIAVQSTPQDASTGTQGLIVLSLADGLYQHLFAYHPSYLPLTRLIGDAWNFDDPAVSPDGSKIAYCTDQNGTWQIFFLNLENGVTTQVTNLAGYSCSPAWSPDGKWLTFENYSGSNSDIVLQSIEDLTESSIQLTSNSGNNYSPAWSPSGREIAFVSDRSGRAEIWLVHLDTPGDRFSVIGSDQDSDFIAPAWSPDGKTLAWCRRDVAESVEVITLEGDAPAATKIGLGCNPKFNPTGDGVLGLLTFPYTNDLVGYMVSDRRVFFPPIEIESTISSFDWSQTLSADLVMQYLRDYPASPPERLWDVVITAPSETGRAGIVALNAVEAPNPYLSDEVDESFAVMRKTLSKELGWDFLSQLESALLPLTTPPQPGLGENWLYTGRALAVSLNPLDAGWMAVSREDYSGVPYWRVWLKCRKQDGSCGQPVHASAWDFNARFSGSQAYYQQGGKVGTPLLGYWLDFTEISSRYGWQRLPALNNWRTFFPASQLDVFVNADDLSWQEALLDLYPPEAVMLLLENQ